MPEELKSSIRTIDTVSTSASSLNSRGRLNVSFKDIEVQEYPIRLGDNPCPCDGPSITIGWKPQYKKIFSVNYFENKRPERRHREELVIPADARIDLMQRSGFSSEQIERSMRKNEEIRKSREKSVANMQWDRLSATKESLGRKLRKAATFGKGSKKAAATNA